MVTVRDLHQLHLYVNALIDEGESPSIENVERAALSGEIVDYLDQEFNAFEALGGPDQILDVDGLNTLFANYYITDSREHLLVENNGLLALSGSIFEILSHNEWDTTPLRSSSSGLLDANFTG
ncbi:hypothetical protein IL252_16880 [Halomicrobium sp. IBSBa]|uniref:hypothetical protein n=1 Tax=Halomicrobium sp. IBSBa TaxID=2778916 RepID=UPI001ABF7094|nr:hypothetical protein [Halomicrobium sp. IBSBa]MBO4249484.1 hypothetical protein [Halomicrobium sp. IBSBa]